jgi:O-antigen/teichoic acid export membrane protein
LIANFGLGNLLLREIGRDNSRLGVLTAEALKARLVISGLLVLVAVLSAPFVDEPALFLILLLANLLESIAETYFVAYRANGMYSEEASLVTAMSVLQLAVVALAAFVFQSLPAVGLAYLLTRTVQFIAIRVALRRTLGALPVAPIKNALQLLKKSWSYALDFALGNLFGHIDSLILRAYAGIGSVGLYQGGMRIFQGGAQLAPILANVFLPSAARSAVNETTKQESAEKIQLAFIACGISGGLVLTYGAELIVSILYGDSFSALASLLPLFGILFFARFFAASWGLILTAHGHQKFRATSTLVHLLFALVLAILWLPKHGVAGWLWALIFANLFLALIYMFGAIRYRAVNISVKVSAAALCGGLAFLPQLIRAWVE